MDPHHLADGEIERFRLQELPPDEVVRLGDHLRACAECRTRVAGPGGAAASAALLAELGFGGSEHVPESDIHAFVAGGPDPDGRVRIASHLAGCPACDEEVRDLSDFASAFDRASPGRPIWLYSLVAAAAVLVLAAGAGWWWRGGRGPGAAVAAGDDTAGLDPSDAARVRAALQTGRLALPPMQPALAGRQGVLMGSPAPPAFRLASPVATVVLDVRPTLRWTHPAGSPTYVVTLEDEAGGRAVDSPPLLSEEWRVDRPLTRGRTYVWQVAATVDGRETVAPRPPDPPVRFTVADEAVARRFERLPASPLARGVMYASAGLLDEAEREFTSIPADARWRDRADGFLRQLHEARVPAARLPD